MLLVYFSNHKHTKKILPNDHKCPFNYEIDPSSALPVNELPFTLLMNLAKGF